MDVEKFLRDTTVRVSAERYAVAQVDEPVSDAFATVQAPDERTVVVEESRLNTLEPLAVKRGWRVFTFEVLLPFDLVGFLARVTTELADAGVSVFVLSAYSTDHVLVKAEDLDTAAERLRGLACTVETPGR
jgi:hypothetical protein